MPCPPEPKRHRVLDELRPDFRASFLRWFNAVNSKLSNGYTLNITETYRTQERQNWLWLQGRQAGCGTSGRPVTWSKDSNHKYRIAADVHIRNAKGVPVWDIPFYQKVYELAPPDDYGLESLAPTEWAHVQIKNANAVRTDWHPNLEPTPLVTVEKWQVKEWGKPVLDNVPVIRIEAKHHEIHIAWQEPLKR